MSKTKRVPQEVAKHIIEEKVYPVNYQLKTPINVNNGILNDQMLERAKRAFVMETVGVWKDDIVKTAQGYPQDDVSDVIFDIDVVILKRDDFDRLKLILEDEELI